MTPGRVEPSRVKSVPPSPPRNPTTTFFFPYSFSGCAMWHVGSQFPDQGWNSYSLHLKQSLNHWTSREIPPLAILNCTSIPIPISTHLQPYSHHNASLSILTTSSHFHLSQAAKLSGPSLHCPPRPSPPQPCFHVPHFNLNSISLSTLTTPHCSLHSHYKPLPISILTSSVNPS